MSRFRTTLQEIAEQATTPPDLAERTLAEVENRRRAGLPVMVTAAVSVALVLVGATAVVSGLVPDPPERSVAAAGEIGQRIRVPEQAPPLPEEGVAPALLAYQPTCAGASDTAESRPLDGRGYGDADCGPWRIMTVHHEHYELSDGRTGPAPNAEVTVSPQGDRLAYWRPDGRVVLHDLASGRLKEQFGWDEVKPVAGSRYAWSADGRWLLALPCQARPDDACGSNARLVDTENEEVYGIGPGPVTDLGDLSNGNRPAVLQGVGTPPEDQLIGLQDGRQLLAYELDADPIRGSSSGTIRGSTSPDGSRVAAITFPQGEADDAESGAPLVSVVNLAEREVVSQYRIEEDSAGWADPRFLGWRGPDHVLLGSYATSGANPRADQEPLRVESFDIRTGERRAVLELPDGVSGISLAYERL